jgi:hypothetical protein
LSCLHEQDLPIAKGLIFYPDSWVKLLVLKSDRLIQFV